MTRRPVWIGDWLRAWRELGDGAPEVAQRLAALFALDNLPPPVDREAEPPPEPRFFDPRPKPEPPPPLLPPPDLPPRMPTGVVQVDALEKQKVAPATGQRDVLPPPATELPQHALQPLFRRAITRNLLSAAAATWRAEGPIAMKVLVD